MRIYEIVEGAGEIGALLAHPLDALSGL